MQYHPEVGPPPTIGLEVEIAKWHPGYNMYGAAVSLEELGYMPAGIFNERRHDYHCRCTTCQEIGTHMYAPPQWKMQRDASLPVEGAEFISSPFPAAEFFIEEAVTAIRALSANAVYPTDRDVDERGRQASVGIHVHCYVPLMTGVPVEELNNALRVFYGFLPEIFALSEKNTALRDRSLEYRMPKVAAGQGGNDDHHCWLAPVRDRVHPRLEWRLWEACYEDPEYLRGIIMFSAAATQLLRRPELFEKIAAANIFMKWTPTTNRVQLRREFSQRRFELLSDLVMRGTAVADDPYSGFVLEEFLRRIERTNNA